MRTIIYSLIFFIAPILGFAQVISYDFEDGNISGWTQSPVSQWSASSLNPIGGAISLRHATVASAELTDRISTPFPSWNSTEGKITWRARIRHNTAPTSGNHWGIFLSCNLDATGMIPSATPNGYAVGVNMEPSSDDILKLYRVTNGVFTPIITSSINWETQVGVNLTSIGAIEVERKPDGIFTLRAAINGQYSSLISQGSVVNTQYSIGGHWGFYFKYTGTNTGKLTADDVSLQYNPTDFNSQVIAPALPISSGIISSVFTTPEQAVDIFKFRIQDQGTSDGLPTFTRKLVFRKVAGASAFSWLDAIGGVILKNSLGELIPITSSTILSESIEINVANGSIPVADGSFGDFTLGLFLKPGSISHGTTLQLKVDSQNHGWVGDLSGSGFAGTFTDDVISNLFSVEVISTHIFFQTHPTQVVINVPFSVSAFAGDSQGNISTSYSGDMQLQLQSGSGTLSFTSGSTATATSGIATWNGVSYSGTDDFSLQATGGGLNAASGSTISVGNDATSVVLEPIVQINAGTISSLATTPEQAIDMFRFRIQDEGSNDGLPTNTRKLVFKKVAGANAASWTTAIGGVKLKNSLGLEIPIVSTNIFDQSIEITTTAEALPVNDGTTDLFTLSLHLKSDGIVDGATIQLKVDGTTHGWEADVTGSAYATNFPSDVVSNILTIEVLPTHIYFQTYPTQVYTNTPFSVSAKVGDSQGNIASSFEEALELEMLEGSGILSFTAGSTINAAAGIATWSGVRYSGNDNFSLKATGQSLTPATGDQIATLTFNSETEIIYDFENGDISAWTQSPSGKWAVSTSTPISGTSSLKHAGSVASSDRISTTLPMWDTNSGSITWRFLLKHGYNPSENFYWGFYLSSNNDATGMISTANTNGYVIGVNFNASTDDFLKLYKVTNGTPTPILTTTLNWQTAITTSGVGAIEVTRLPNGEFTVKAGLSSFSNLQTFGSVIDTQYPYGGFFGLHYTSGSSGLGLLRIDDISLKYKAINPNDHDAIIATPTTQVSGTTISSLFSTPEQAFDIFKFRIQDQGTSDGLSTFTRKLVFKKVDGANALAWPSAIGGVMLKDNMGNAIPITSFNILTNTIEVLVAANAMPVANGGFAEFTLGAFLKSGSISNGATLQLKVDSNNHEWETDLSGSDFAESFPLDVISNTFTIEVIPTHLFFQTYPTQINANSLFNVSAYAGDSQGNIGSSFSGLVQLQLLEGLGTLNFTDGSTVSAISGIATWSGVSYTNRDAFSLTAISQDLVSAVGATILISNDATSVALAPDNQAPSALIPSTITTPGDAVEVMRFKISDPGNNDGTPTKVQQLLFKRTAGGNVASLTRNIGGVVIRKGNEIISIGNPNILTSTLTVPIPENAMVINDGETVEYSLWIFLKPTGLEDGKEISLTISSDEHGFIANPSGSQFSTTFPSPIVSNVFTVSVAATKLLFTTTPASVGIDEPFNVTVTAVDNGGNADIHATGVATLSLNTGNGLLTIPTPSQSLASGATTWTGLKYNTAQPFTLLASATVLNDCVSPLIYCSDRTSTILNPTTALTGGAISSLAVDTESAVEVFRFRINDPGTTDGLPTHITQLTFKSFGGVNAMPLNKAIKGVVLKVNGESKLIATTAITGDLITLTFEQGVLTVNNLETVNVSLEVYLNKGGLENGAALRLFVPASGHGWLFSATGSGFPTVFTGSVYGPSFTIEVLPTSIRFTNQPFGISTTPSTFELEASATDIYGNVATAATGTATLSLHHGIGTFQATESTVTFVNGVANWSSLSVTNVGKYKFKATTVFGQEVTGYSEDIWCGLEQTCKYNEDFDSGYPFAASSVWGASSVTPIAGAMSFKHMLTGVAGESQLALPLNISDINNGPVEWSFAMRNGNWDPSSDNTFWFVLMSDSVSIKSGNYNGYAVGVNLSGTSDKLSLWKMSKTSSAKLLIESDFDWDESETVLVKVTRNPAGEWSLWFQAEFGISEVRLGGKIVDNQYLSSKYCGPVFKYTSSRAGEFWLDNLKICETAFPPIISSARAKSLTSVEVVFSKNLNKSSAETSSNYKIKTLAGTQIQVIDAHTSSENAKMVTLRTSMLPLEALWLTAKGVQDLSGNVANDSIMFGIGTFGAFGNVIINEVMAKPDPAIELPAVEYIELYNRTQLPINLKSWKLKGNTTTVTIPERTIDAGGFVILCSTGSVGSLSAYGTAVGVTSFPSLLNSGMSLRLYDSDLKLMSWVDYSETWYGSDIKKAGGYSLEKIDPNNLVEGKRNWTGSNDPSGGTPGRANSVFASNPDIFSPTVVEVKVLTPTSIMVTYSETMDSLQITLPANYTISNGIGNPLWAVSEGPLYNTATLSLSSTLAYGESYQLCFGSQTIDFSGNTLDAECWTIALHQTPIAQDVVINEILFNPYSGGVDFVEVYNRSSKIVDLNRIKIANRNRTTGLLNESYAASDTSFMLFPNSYAVMSTNSSLVKRFYYVENENALVWVRKLPSYSNDNGTALLINENSLIVDEFAYNEKMHFSLLNDRKGVSLERINPALPTNEASSWQSAAQTAGFATPTARNSQFKETGEAEEAFELVDKVFSPDGDGYNDVLLINYNLPEDGYTANIIVFDSQGRRVRRLASNLTLGTSGTLKWDGTTDENRKANLGAYVVFIEAYIIKNNVKQNVKQYKKTCVVATRFNN
jgi:hypothetical protein